MDLHNEQMKVINLLSKKVEQVEKVAHNLEIKVRSGLEAPAKLGLREKVFEICRLLFDQQKAAIVTLKAIEDRVALLRDDFATAIQRNRPWITPGQID